MKNTIKLARRPQQQGHIDGLCAIYAVLNSCKFLLGHTEEQDEKLFRELCLAGRELFPEIVFKGAGVPDVRMFLKAAQTHVRIVDGKILQAKGISSRMKFRSVLTFFKHLRRELESARKGHRRVWIIGLNKPWDHWTVVRKVTDDEVWFYDSYGMRRFRLSSFTFDMRQAGDNKGQKIMIDQHQSFLVDVS